jgi:hypothetical protein
VEVSLISLFLPSKVLTVPALFPSPQVTQDWRLVDIDGWTQAREGEVEEEEEEKGEPSGGRREGGGAQERGKDD